MTYQFLRRFAEVGCHYGSRPAVGTRDADMRVCRALAWISSADADPKPLRAILEMIVSEDPSRGRRVAELWL